jgi:hypothetical protein
MTVKETVIVKMRVKATVNKKKKNIRTQKVDGLIKKMNKEKRKKNVIHFMVNHKKRLAMRIF